MTPTLHHLKVLARRLSMVALACLLGLGTAWAQAPDADPPGRVGRVAETYGQVWLYSPDSGEWVSAVRNRPVTSGDRLATDHGARVELNIGSTTMRLDANTELEVLRLDDDQVVVQLHAGSAAARVRDARAVGEFELETAEGRFRVQAAGRYRFDRYDRGSQLTVYAGQAIYEGPGSALTVYAGQRGEFWLESNGAAQYSMTEPVRDAFAAWIGERDRSEDRIAASRYVSPEMTGAEDLDRYGRWEQSPEYGALWFPRGVSSDWAPYSTGHWAWVRPWGWTWVDDAPWGFAPFHYGRWVRYRSAWCWSPGRYVARPVYAPALVAWIGGAGSNLSISIGGGPAVGWFPLAPREVYVPAYRASSRYVREVNVTHVTNINIINNPPRDYANRRYPHALTVVPASVVTNREPVAPSAARYRDLPPVRSIVNGSVPVTALVAPPVVSPPAHASRGVETRPFRRPGEGAPGRVVRPPPNASEEARTGVAAPAAPVFPSRAPVNASEEARQGPVVAPPGAAMGEERRRRDRRDAVPPPAALPVPGAPPTAAQRGDAPRRVPGPPVNASEEARTGVPAGVAPEPVAPRVAPVPEERRGRDRRDAGGPPPRAVQAPPNIAPPQPQGGPPQGPPAGARPGRPEGPRPVPPPNVAPQQPQVAPPQPQVAPRPARPEAPPPAAVRRPEPPPPVSASEEARTSDRGQPGGPRGRDDRP